ncbi:hypothetical protein ANCCAN_25706 [Ancylostoma caninum]|uniref:Receptor ligand binding region domain-containing protein n=1 Tax=Ancylostoma caninum TaxID=29170 RepID=A0A368FC12_ANCCA|nr:hypothetical protein ANCCAN_25706 [Ancylostoma caninum]
MLTLCIWALILRDVCAATYNIVCDVMQHSVVAVLIPNTEERLDETLLKSMCHHFRDLSLLEDFLNNVYGSFHCNITGLQLVKNDPMMKTSLALTSEAVWVVGTALHKMTDVSCFFSRQTL